MARAATGDVHVVQSGVIDNPVATEDGAFDSIRRDCRGLTRLSGPGRAGHTPTWGAMLSDGRANIRTAWWLATFPGIIIMLTVLSINLLGNWLRVRLDPRHRGM